MAARDSRRDKDVAGVNVLGRAQHADGGDLGLSVTGEGIAWRLCDVFRHHFIIDRFQKTPKL